LLRRLPALRPASAAQEFFDLASQRIGLLTSGRDGLRRRGLRSWLDWLLPSLRLDGLRGRFLVEVVQLFYQPEETEHEKNRDLNPIGSGKQR
jgi:hypothetical protein